MKISLVVASGAHQGKAIPIAGAQFVIGRDEGCNLRPASPAISKKHCAIVVQGGRVLLKDLGSTNGTFVNDEPLQGERELVPGDHLKVGPLEFTIEITGRSDSTPLPEQLQSVNSPASSKLVETIGNITASKATPGASKPVSGPVSEQDDAAAMLLGLDDDGDSNPHVPEGSTVMDMPAVDGTKKPTEAAKPPVVESSSAANELLRKYLRRPK